MIVTRKIKYILPIIALILISGCSSNRPKPLYNYENYGQSYYSYKKTMTPETTLAFQESIEKIIAGTESSSSGRVPPGMYANLGYIYLKGGKSSEAIINFTKEKTIYPESSHFMDRIINKIKAIEGEKKQ